MVSPLHYRSIEYPRNNSKLNKSGHQLQEQNWLRIHLFFPRQPDWSIALFEEAVLSSDHLPWLFNESRAFYWLWKPAKHGGRLAGWACSGPEAIKAWNLFQKRRFVLLSTPNRIQFKPTIHRHGYIFGKQCIWTFVYALQLQKCLFSDSQIKLIRKIIFAFYLIK